MLPLCNCSQLKLPAGSAVSCLNSSPRPGLHLPQCVLHWAHGTVAGGHERRAEQLTDERQDGRGLRGREGVQRRFINAQIADYVMHC